MLNIHSFLPAHVIKKEQSEFHRCKMGFAITCYVMIVVITVLSLEGSKGAGAYAAEVSSAALVLEQDNQGETAEFVHIQTDKGVGSYLRGVGPEVFLTISVPNVVENYMIEQMEEEQRREKERAEKIAQKAKEEAAIRAKEQAEAKKIAKEKEIAEKKAEQLKKKKEEAEKKKVKISEKDKNILLRIVEAEATGGDVKSKMLVANVILNRVKSSKFPDTVEGVVFQKGGGVYQFSPIKDGRYYSVSISSGTRKAVNRVLAGEDVSKGALYFMARKIANPSNVRWFDNHLTRVMQYGSHEFYK